MNIVKRNYKKMVISAILAVFMFVSSGILPFTAYAAEEASGTCGDTAQYKIDDDGTLTIWGYGSIEEKAFDKVGKIIRNVVIKEGITSIEESAFASQKYIVSVSLPESLNLIGSYAFYNCESLESINLNYVTSIQGYAFRNCKNLKEIEFNDDKTVSIDAGAFHYSGLEEIYIPENVNMLEPGSGGQGTFSSCNNLRQHRTISI